MRGYSLWPEFASHISWMINLSFIGFGIGPNLENSLSEGFPWNPIFIKIPIQEKIYRPGWGDKTPNSQTGLTLQCGFIWRRAGYFGGGCYIQIHPGKNLNSEKSKYISKLSNHTIQSWASSQNTMNWWCCWYELENTKSNQLVLGFQEWKTPKYKPKCRGRGTVHMFLFWDVRPLEIASSTPWTLSKKWKGFCTMQSHETIWRSGREVCLLQNPWIGSLTVGDRGGGGKGRREASWIILRDKQRRSNFFPVMVQELKLKYSPRGLR